MIIMSKVTHISHSAFLPAHRRRKDSDQSRENAGAEKRTVEILAPRRPAHRGKGMRIAQRTGSSRPAAPFLAQYVGQHTPQEQNSEPNRIWDKAERAYQQTETLSLYPVSLHLKDL